jgi:hypothetical protein
MEAFRKFSADNQLESIKEMPQPMRVEAGEREIAELSK